MDIQLPVSHLFLQDMFKVQVIESQMENNKQAFTTLRENLQMVKNRMKPQVYQHQSERQTKEGNWVFLRLQPYRKSTHKKRRFIN